MTGPRLTACDEPAAIAVTPTFIWIRASCSDYVASDVAKSQAHAATRSWRERCRRFDVHFLSSRQGELRADSALRHDGDVVELSGRCLTCHQEQSCSLFPTRGHALAGKCVDCHMPLQTSNLVISDLEGPLERAHGRTHWIRVYPDTANH